MRYTDLEAVINDFQSVKSLKDRVESIRMSWSMFGVIAVTADIDGRAVKVQLNASDDYDGVIAEKVLELLERKVNLLEEDLRKRVEDDV